MTRNVLPAHEVIHTEYENRMNNRAFLIKIGEAAKTLPDDGGWMFTFSVHDRTVLFADRTGKYEPLIWMHDRLISLSDALRGPTDPSPHQKNEMKAARRNFASLISRVPVP